MQHLCVQSNMFIVYSTVIKTLWLELSVFGILTDSSLLLLAPSSAQQEKNLIIWIWIQNNVDIFYKITSLKITILCEVRLTHCNFYKKRNFDLKVKVIIELKSIRWVEVIHFKYFLTFVWWRIPWMGGHGHKLHYTILHQFNCYVCCLVSVFRIRLPSSESKEGEQNMFYVKGEIPR